MSWNFDLPFIFLVAVVISGLIALCDKLWWEKQRKADGVKKMPTIIEYARSFFPILLVVMLIRSFWVQPYKVPTGSLEPTVQPVEYLLLNQYIYGIKLPVWDKTIIPVSHPKRADIALFHWPVNQSIEFIKRVVGVPGDSISMIDNVLYINGKKCEQKFIRYTTDTNGANQPTWRVKEMEENLLGHKHKIFLCADDYCRRFQQPDFYNVKIPKGQYMMIGDNRDNSDDSRSWGLVDEKNFVGRGMFIWWSWDFNWHIRWHRLGTVLR